MAAPDARSGDEAATEELLSEVDDLTPGPNRAWQPPGTGSVPSGTC